jgi:hypothetical protein
MFTTGKQLRRIAKQVKVRDTPMESVWKFAPDAPLPTRPTGGRIVVSYPANVIQYDYDRKTNTYLRTVSREGKQKDADTGKRVAPKNVVVMVVHFGPLNDGSGKARLEADLVGQGTAWIATNGRTIKGTWRKASETAPTRFFDGGGDEVTLTIGQTFIQVMPNAGSVSFKAGKRPPTTFIPRRFTDEGD